MFKDCLHALLNSASRPCQSCGSINDVCFRPPARFGNSEKPSANDKHDVVLMDGEPGLTVAARDIGSWFWPLLYAEYRDRDWEQFCAVARNMFDHQATLPAEPHKDEAHAWSARNRSIEMKEWKDKHQGVKPARGRVNDTGPDAGTPRDEDVGTLANQFEIEALKHARPEREPEEAS